MLSTSARGVLTTPPSPMSKAGTSSPRPTASSATTPGIDIRFPRAAFGLTRQTITLLLPTRQKCALPCGPARLTITREGCGSGEAKAPTPGEAHELALKAAETDATKRALATFGNPFGLALYDRELAGVKNRKALISAPDEYRGPWLLSLPNGAGQSFSKADEFVVALRKALTEAADIEQLFAIWERNVDAVRAINKQTNRSTPRGVIAQNLVAHMKGRAIALAKQGSQASERSSDDQDGSRPKVDKSVLTIAEPKRIRSKGAPTFCSQPALRDLRPNPCPRPSRSLCTTKRFGAQSER